MIITVVVNEVWATKKSFDFRTAHKSLTDSITQILTPILLPEVAHQDMSFIRISGQQRNIKFSFLLTPSDTDLSDGTGANITADSYMSADAGADTVVLTIYDQFRWLCNYIFDPSMDAQFYLYDETWYPDTNAGSEPNGIKVVVKDINIAPGESDTEAIPCVITLLEGVNMNL